MSRVVDILLVEDSLGDAKLTMKALARSTIENRVHHVKDGVEAVEFLRGCPGKPEPIHPDLILLDLNLPRKDGREVLADIKADPELMRIPVVVLTTSRTDADIRGSYELHANCYVNKPVDLQSFMKVVSFIDQFWFSVAQLPEAQVERSTS